MTGFIIFAVVLTIGYILYYAAVIATDMSAQKKSGKSEEENITVGNDSEEVDDFATQKVVEDSNGGFSFLTPEVKEEKQEQPDEIAEAVDAPVVNNVITAESISDETPQGEDHPEEDVSEGFNTYTYSVNEQESEPEQKPFNDEEAFDPSVRQKKYDVKDVFEPQSSPEVQNHADTVNSSLEQIQRHSTRIYSESFLDTLKNNPNGDTNIEITNVQSRL